MDYLETCWKPPAGFRRVSGGFPVDFRRISEFFIRIFLFLKKKSGNLSETTAIIPHRRTPRYSYFCHCQVLTKDSVTVSVDAVVYYRVSNATVSVANVENAHHSTRLLAQTTLRNILGTKSLHEILSDRESISNSMQVGLLLLSLSKVTEV